MVKKFCIAGPINPEINYFVPHRLDGEELKQIIEEQQYFVLHAPRQSGKTTAVMEFIRYLNTEGSYKALYINVESAQAARENIQNSVTSILYTLRSAIKDQLPNDKATVEFLEEDTKVPFNAFKEALQFWAKNSSQPIVLFIDEIDALIGDTLLSILRQIREGFVMRPKQFPQSICLIGLRDVRDYRIWSRHEGKQISTSSPFNIKATSLSLKNFNIEEIRALYSQHTEETGQVFTPESIAYVYELTAGQPWLVNALAYRACYVEGKDQQINKDVIERAKDALIKKRDTHIDSLLDKLSEERVRPIIEAIITGTTVPFTFPPDDLQYVRDLGLITQDKLDIANPIYREIIPRELTHMATESITQTCAPFLRPDGSLDVSALLDAFTDFYRENASIWLEKFNYKEAGPHLLLMAFLQRVINGGGKLQREYALGTGRVDILLQWRKQTVVIELKIYHSKRTLSEGLQQTSSYMDVSQANEGHLVIFDRSPNKLWEEKIYHYKEEIDGKTIDVWGL